ncbi:MAG: riboflavin synthase subunit alpha [Phycisphaerae bacterium]|nr:MAG: riboflavin synthase subunit alpha [Phycisphaerae bacterium]
MFTGIIETTGKVASTTTVAGGRRITIDAGLVAEDAKLGASIAINGVCLTITSIDNTRLSFDVITESLDRTNLGSLKSGSNVNLERALKPDSRMDGHFVQGHVDGVASVVKKTTSEKEWVLWLRPDENVREFVIPKGSIAIDGISLTIAKVDGDTFSVAIIPTTLEHTNLSERSVGDRVNIESDIIARTVVSQLNRLRGGGSEITMDALREHGFI